MAIDIPTQDPIRVGTASTDIYTAPSTPSQLRAVNMQFGLMADGTGTDPVTVTVHHVTTNGTYGTDTEVEQITISQNKSAKTRKYRLGPGGKIVMTADQASQVLSNLEDGVLFS